MLLKSLNMGKEGTFCIVVLKYIIGKGRMKRVILCSGQYFQRIGVMGHGAVVSVHTDRCSD